MAADVAHGFGVSEPLAAASYAPGGFPGGYATPGGYAAPSAGAGSGLEFQEQLFRLQQEKRELEEYADKVTKELRRYQSARPTPPPARAEDDTPLPPWATNMQMMSPLLFAYEERIAELEAVVERSVTLAEQSQALTKENDSLRAELQDRTEQLRNAQLMAPMAREDGAAGGRLEELQDLYRLSVEQNEALAQQNQLLKVQLDRMQQSLVVCQQQIRDSQARAVESGRAQTMHQERADAVTQQRSIAEQRLEQVTAELVEEVRLREQLQVQNQGLQHDLKLQGQSLDLSKKSFQDRCELAKEEEARLTTDLTRATQAERDHRQKLLALETELSQVSEQLYQARNESDATKQEAIQMIKLIESLEKKLRDVEERTDQANSLLAEREAQVSELTLEKDYWTSAEQAAKRQAERVNSRFEGEIETLKQQKDSQAESLQSSHKTTVAELEERLRKSEQSASETQTKLELVSKQRTWEAASLERQTSLHASEKSRLQEDLEEAHQVRLRLERHADEHQREMAQLRSELDIAASRSKEQATKASAEVSQHRAKCQSIEQQLAQAREEVQSLELRAASATSEQLRIRGEVENARSSATESLEAERRKAQLEKHRLERQLQNVVAKAQQDERRAVELMRAQENLRQRWQTELGLEKDALEAQVERLAAENRQIREKSRGLLRALRMRSSDDDADLPSS
eukprot:TRINITY_DN25230_c0_g1_i1.p1 TRINITY_DN25230_c0_g1~~TRINITY_DN25230_c0_g1_i1.p1  ORF type:complete len:690 (-),score=244.88 TRINITY_DN25230_c0_g1_i1:215-2284(-)